MIPPTMTCSDVMVTCLAKLVPCFYPPKQIQSKMSKFKGVRSRGSAAQSLYTTLYYPSMPL